jgi:hypothetical protein
MNNLLILTVAVVILFGILLLVTELKKRGKSEKLTDTKTIMVKRFEISDRLAVQIFQRQGGSFGYYYIHKYGDGSAWMPPTSMGDGSVYDTAKKVEEYARSNYKDA